MKKILSNYSKYYFIGLCMGIADLIPGVSGGTIAFFFGIYKKFITELSNINLKLITDFKNQIKKIDILFFIFLGAGIVTTILSLSHLFSFLLKEKAFSTWSFFTGLIFAGVIKLSIDYKIWKRDRFIYALLGMILGYLVYAFGLVTLPLETPYFILSGMLGISAMMLPGISGSYILLLLGHYSKVIWSVKALNSEAFSILIPLAMGMVLGVLLFAKVLKNLLYRFEIPMMSLMIGFIWGTSPKILPFHYGEFSYWGIIFFLLGILVIYLQNKYSAQKKSQ